MALALPTPEKIGAPIPPSPMPLARALPAPENIDAPTAAALTAAEAEPTADPALDTPATDTPHAAIPAAAAMTPKKRPVTPTGDSRTFLAISQR